MAFYIQLSRTAAENYLYIISLQNYIWNKLQIKSIRTSLEIFQNISPLYDTETRTLGFDVFSGSSVFHQYWQDVCCAMSMSVFYSKVCIQVRLWKYTFVPIVHDQFLIPTFSHISHLISSSCLGLPCWIMKSYMFHLAHEDSQWYKCCLCNNMDLVYYLWHNHPEGMTSYGLAMNSCGINRISSAIS